MKKEQFAIVTVMGILIVIATAAFIYNVYGSTLSLEPPPPPSLYMNGTMTNLTADDKDRDLSIDPTDELPANGTQVMSTARATDMDINEFPPPGVSVIIQSDAITVTNHTVDISTDLDEETEEQETESDDG